MFPGSQLYSTTWSAKIVGSKAKNKNNTGTYSHDLNTAKHCQVARYYTSAARLFLLRIESHASTCALYCIYTCLLVL